MNNVTNEKFRVAFGLEDEKDDEHKIKMFSERYFLPSIVR
jgi:hypothetical protein